MKKLPPTNHRAFTLLEICLALALVAGMAGLVAWGLSNYSSYREQVRIEAALNLVASGQRNYLLANPTQGYSDLTKALVTPYIPTGSWPSALSSLSVTVNSFPPSTTWNSKTLTAKDL